MAGRKALELYIKEWFDKHEPDVELVLEVPSFTFQTRERNMACASCGSHNVVKARVYTPDIYFPATEVYIEGKGKFPAPRRRILRDFGKARKDVDLRFVFQADNWLTKAKKTRYTGWARMYGFPAVVWSVQAMRLGTPPIPEEWYRDTTQL